MQVQFQNLWIFIKTENSIARLQREERETQAPCSVKKHGDIKFSMDKYTGNNFSCGKSITGEICYVLQAKRGTKSEHGM